MDLNLDGPVSHGKATDAVKSMSRQMGVFGMAALLLLAVGCAHTEVDPRVPPPDVRAWGYDLSVSVMEVGRDPARARPDLEKIIADELGEDLNGIAGHPIDDNDPEDRNLFDLKRKFLNYLWEVGPQNVTVPAALVPTDETSGLLVISVRSLTIGPTLGILSRLAILSADLTGDGLGNPIDSEVIWAVILPNREVSAVGKRKGHDLRSAKERRELFREVTDDINRYIEGHKKFNWTDHAKMGHQTKRNNQDFIPSTLRDEIEGFG